MTEEVSSTASSAATGSDPAVTPGVGALVEGASAFAKKVTEGYEPVASSQFDSFLKLFARIGELISPLKRGLEILADISLLINLGANKMLDLLEALGKKVGA